jgi:hypothetical protein
VVVEHPRTYLRRTSDRFDIIQVPPQESFQVVASGAFSLAEHYVYAVEAFRDYLRHLAPGGVVAVTRWIQTPPSEEVRLWAAAVAALERLNLDAASRLIALRSLNTMTVLIKPDGFTPGDVATVRAFSASRRFDITYAPGLGSSDSNRYNVLPVDLHRKGFIAVLDPFTRTTFLDEYRFDVRPVSDNRPFFFHFFRWRQVPLILANLGRTWQPFGGGGYLILLVLLVIVALLSAALILAPLRALGAEAGSRSSRRWPILAYFFSLGLAFLFIEIPLLQQLILTLGSPTYAAAAVLCGLLLASGAGSLVAPRLEPWHRVPLAMLVVLLAAVAWALPRITDATLGLSLPGRLAALTVVVLPVGMLMGVPFPAGIRFLGRIDRQLIPLAWGINGCASVVGSVLAVMVALEWGFRTVLLLGAMAYGSAWLTGPAAAWMRQARAESRKPA